jgi:tRNA(Ile)-lysidine synthase
MSFRQEGVVSLPHPFVRQVGRRLRRLGVSTGAVVVAVSGGPDSVALLRALVALKRGDELVVAHVNHQLRGLESDADEDFVRNLHARLAAEGASKLALRCFRADTAQTARHERANLEAVARKIRYEWLGQVAAETGARWIATGHTADDQAETVLHRLLRGTGLKGLRGIAPRRSLTSTAELVRPLLGMRRAEVLAYLDDVGQSYRTDSSNRDPRFTRNRIRHELLPLLEEEFNPRIVDVLARLARQANEAYRREEQQARALLAEVERPRAGSTLILDRGVLASAPVPLVRAVFRLLWEREGWPTGRMNFDAWDRLAGVARGEIGAVDLPGGVRVRATERVVRIEHRP